jgi:Nucleotide modification associated domain 3
MKKEIKAILVRIGIDQAYGNWNAPVDEEKNFVYVPIPEKLGTHFHPGLERKYNEILPKLEHFCKHHNYDLYNELRFPKEILNYSMHLDPDFDYLTYGDVGKRRGARIAEMNEGDMLVFYGGFRPVYKCEFKLIYALIGIYVVKEIFTIYKIPTKRWHENAHVRRIERGTSDIIVYANPIISGRFDKCIPIGEWRQGAYRVKQDILNEWGGLSVKNGFIQRSAVPPTFNNPQNFLNWLRHKKVKLIQKNN